MSTGNKLSLNPAVGTDTPPAMLSPDEALLVLQNLRQQLPLPAPEVTISHRRRLAFVDGKFIQAALNAVRAFLGVQQVLGRTADDLQQEVDTANKWAGVATELSALLRSVVGANLVRQQRIGLTALQTYKICQQLTREESNDVLLEHVAEMKRFNRFGRSRRKGAPPAEPVQQQQ